MVLLAALPFSQTLAFVLAALVPIALLSVTFGAAPKIILTTESLQVGKMNLPLAALGDAQFFVGEKAQFERGPGLSPGSQRLFRGDIGSVVKIFVVDRADPTEYLLFSSRKGGELVSALDANRSELGL
jgi:hypothetical protein